MKKTINVRGYTRIQNGKKVEVSPHERKIEKLSYNNYPKFNKNKGPVAPHLNDVEEDIGTDIGFKQGLSRRSVKTSEIIYGFNPKEMEEYPMRQKAMLSLEKKKIIERRESERNVEPSWKLSEKGKDIFEDSYEEGKDARNDYD